VPAGKGSPTALAVEAGGRLESSESMQLSFDATESVTALQASAAFALSRAPSGPSVAPSTLMSGPWELGVKPNRPQAWSNTTKTQSDS